VVCLDAPDADAPMPDIDPSSGTPEASEAARAKGGEAQQTGRQPGHPSVSSFSAQHLMCRHVERLVVV
jgi:hypothetical protein